LFSSSDLGWRWYSSLMCGLRATTSPTSPTGSSVASSHVGIGPSSTATIRSSTPGSGAPTHTPAPFSVAVQVPSTTSSPAISVSGSASVAP
jgi:hypothetical protein